MQFRSCSTGRRFSILFALTMPLLVFAQLDWDNDVVVFGTEHNERNPQLVSIGTGMFRAFCIRNDNALSMRASQLQGEIWEQYYDTQADFVPLKFETESDDLNSYVSTYAFGSQDVYFRKITHASQSWAAPSLPIALPDTVGIFDVRMVSDHVFASDDPFLHMFVLAGVPDGTSMLGYLHAENHGQDWYGLGWFAANLPTQDSSASISGAVTWESEDERLWVATTVDRPGTTGEQIILFHSDNLGENWSAAFFPDSSSYAQSIPALVGYENTLMLVYQRRVSPSLARDIFAVYSPDGGVSWSEPLQLTDSPFDDIAPKVAISNDIVGLCYARAPIQQEQGQLFFRQTSLAQPWAWEEEVAICGEGAFFINEGYDLCSDVDGFAAVWTGRLVGDDGDVFFDGSWRGTSVDAPRSAAQARLNVFPNPSTGWLRLNNDSQIGRGIKLFDILGREVAGTELRPGSMTWQLPISLPSGSYWLSAGIDEKAVRIQILK